MTPDEQARAAIRTLVSYLDVDDQTGQTHLAETAPAWVQYLYQHMIEDDEPDTGDQVIAWAANAQPTPSLPDAQCPRRPTTQAPPAPKPRPPQPPG